MRRILLVLVPILLVCCSSNALDGHSSPGFTVSDGVMDGLTIGKNAYSKTFSVTSDGDWKIVRRSGQQWINISPSEGSGDGSITVSAEANNTGQARRAFFDVELNGRKTYVIEILQTLTEVGGTEPDQGDDGGSAPEVEKVFPILAWEDIPFDKSAERFPSSPTISLSLASVPAALS